MQREAHPSIILLRFAAGLIFLAEGTMKFLDPQALGVGRFERIGLPGALAPFVAVVEIVCGSALLLGAFTRLSAIPLAIDMAVAIASTKIPILLGRGYGPFAHTFAPKAGLGPFLHESRTDLALLAITVYLAIVGAGRWSLDARR
jgi:uncharacterized membrane protein YphA (DoxX/SURF4 family)